MNRHICKFNVWGFEGQVEFNSEYVVNASDMVKEYVGKSADEFLKMITDEGGTYSITEKKEIQVQAIMFTISDYCEAIELAKANGKKAGDSIEAEVMEICRRKEVKPKKLGSLNDPDMLLANLREYGVTRDKRILFIDNEKKEKEDDTESK